MKLLQALVDRKRRSNNRETIKSKKDMMDLLMEVKDEDGRQLEDEDIIDLVLVFLLAGHESSAHGILWTIIYLIDHPHVLHMAKVSLHLSILWIRFFFIRINFETHKLLI